MYEHGSETLPVKSWASKVALHPLSREQFMQRQKFWKFDPMDYDSSIRPLLADVDITEYLKSSDLDPKPKRSRPIKSTQQFVFGLKSPDYTNCGNFERQSLALELALQNKKFTDTMIFRDSNIKEKMKPSLSIDAFKSLCSSDAAVVLAARKFSCHGIYGSVGIMRRPLLGACVFATDPIGKNTFICEYVGELRTHRDILTKQLDSTMDLLDPKTQKSDDRLVIVAEEKCNLARFINGVNSKTPNWEHRANLRVHRVLVNDEICVILFACRDILKGEELRYDYGPNYDLPLPW